MRRFITEAWATACCLLVHAGASVSLATPFIVWYFNHSFNFTIFYLFIRL
jgi:hypothetical protein